MSSEYAVVKGPYKQKSVRSRIEAFFLDNDGDIDPIGGGTVKLTPDHKKPHSINPDSDPTNPDQWQPLCGRHQVMKKNFWDHETGWLNVYAIIQAAKESEKRKVYDFLKIYFGDDNKPLP